MSERGDLNLFQVFKPGPFLLMLTICPSQPAPSPRTSAFTFF